jgi:hypothetical protein
MKLRFYDSPANEEPRMLATSRSVRHTTRVTAAPLIYSRLSMKDVLVQIVRALHMSVGITPPPPEQSWIYALIWFGVLLAMIGTFLLLFVGVHYHWF